MGARKGLKHKTHSKEVKLEILAKLETNQSHLSIAREYGVSVKTIENWQTKHRKGIDITNDTRFKKVEKSDEPTYEELKQELEIVKKMQKFLKDQQNKK